MEHYTLYSAEQFALDKYFQEWVLSPKEQSNRDWLNFIERYPHKKPVIDNALELVRLTGLTTDESVNSAFIDGWQKIQAADMRRVRVSTYRRISTIAASLLVLAIAAYFLISRNSPKLEFRTTYGEIKTITLDDGSIVTLNANSSIVVEGLSSGSKSRKVNLNGDAFFEVKHTVNNTPFVVVTGEDVEVHVLGTSFSVNEKNNVTKVYLQSGKVQLKARAYEKLLTPGDEVTFASQENRLSVAKIPSAMANDNLAWLKNEYVMNDRALSDVLEDIKSNFGKTAIVSDSALLQKKVSAKVPANDLNVLLSVLSQALELKIEEKDGRLYISTME